MSKHNEVTLKGTPLVFLKTELLHYCAALVVAAHLLLALLILPAINSAMADEGFAPTGTLCLNLVPAGLTRPVAPIDRIELLNVPDRMVDFAGMKKIQIFRRGTTSGESGTWLHKSDLTQTEIGAFCEKLDLIAKGAAFLGTAEISSFRVALVRCGNDKALPNLVIVQLHNSNATTLYRIAGECTTALPTIN